VWLKGVGQLKKSNDPHQELNLKPSGLQHIASTMPPYTPKNDKNVQPICYQVDNITHSKLHLNFH
jgi:hypothetical protein